ncbi:MAG TPA: cytochrome P450 [Ideonella sp.]|nr:cytochrome P450 [Ideonella sp.]
MNDPQRRQDWDPTSEAVQRDQRAAYDELRERCPVAHSDLLGWSLFRHADVLRALEDPVTFSSVVSAHRAVPNGMDPPEHTEYRRIVEPYFSAERVQAFEPRCRAIAAGLARSLSGRDAVEFVAGFADPFAVQVQCAFLGWPDAMRMPLQRWTLRNYAVRRGADRAASARIAAEFEQLVLDMLSARRGADDAAEDDVTSRLMRERVWGRPLADGEIVSILRNWTVGEIATISAAVGIVVHDLARHPDRQAALRAQPARLPAAIDEMLRLHGPLVTNRRVATCAVEVGGRRIAAGERVTLNWVAANRDERAFDDALAFRPERDPSANLLYGAGIHVCPGAPLARMELRVAIEELLAATARIEPADAPASLAAYPASGFVALPLRLHRP